MEKNIKKISDSVNEITDEQKIKEICDYASESFDKVIIIGMKKINYNEEYRIMSNYSDDKEIVWNLEAAKTSILNQIKN